MKLNNKGWGLSAFVAYMAIFILAIVLVAFLVGKNGMGSNSFSNLYSENDEDEKYIKYESIVKEKSILYQEEYYPNLTNGNKIKVDIRRLDIPKEIAYKCSGYVVIQKSEGIFSYSPYLNCDSYITKGYSE